MEKIMDVIDQQNAEFDALEKLYRAYQALPQPVDEYPEAKYKYDSALRQFLGSIFLRPVDQSSEGNSE